jgi:hypothetical protein
MAITTVPAWKWPIYTPTTQKQTLDWTAYDPKLIQSAWTPTEQTAYSGAESGAISKLSDIIKYGGYSPEQKQAMLQGAMQPVYQQAEEAGRSATGSAYARGLGQSGVLQRSLTDIQKGVGSSMASLAGGIEQQSAAQVLPAIGAVQTGQANLQGMLQQQSQYNANLAQQREQLAVQLNMKQGDLQSAINQINATLDMSDADRQVKLAEIMNNYQLDATKIQVLQEEAKKDRIASFWASLLGGAATVTGGVLGQVLKPAAAVVA